MLEPFLVEKMVTEVYQSTQKILDSINDWLELGSDDPKHEKESAYSHISKVDDRNSQAQYSRRTNDCPDLADTLSLMQRLSEANSETLNKWRVRELARLHKPRWSERMKQNTESGSTLRKGSLNNKFLAWLVNTDKLRVA